MKRPSGTATKTEITILDMAKELQVSKSTISRALQDHHSIGAAMKQAVRDLAAKYNYQPNAIASSLSNRSTKTIGVIIPILYHYFFAAAIAGIEETAYAHGYKVIICQSGESYEREVIAARTLFSARVDGLIVSVSRKTSDMEHFKLFQDKNIPLIFFDRLPVGIESDSISVDDYQGAYKVVEHLVKRGYKKIAHFAGPLNITLCQNRLRGYKDALQDNGLPFDESLVYECGFERRHGVQTAKQLQKSNLPDAIFAVCDAVAVGVILTLKERGISVPKTVAVAGFNDDPIATIVDPPLTTTVQPAFAMGEEAAKIFFKKVDGKAKKPVKKILKTSLVVRKST
ncbi:LacI family DNA-binding transcriptional regulator [Mucilaginibacter mali]|uniref:LacI family DNA-binding transcriptional regulator n=1 Tax=Mucilaginibacter mali TaxID=2740462 RepID=A0A7D4TLS1_9SPHI|nr:LacI family DNA-binding transcriptional regulator [Mucilaginibacter mali]QKJ29513.1 LacI family DNA-binding transcriptional regulator [Mucilaginibacter mali]